MNTKVMSEFVHLCQIVGNRIPIWTQGQGGNISIKTDQELLIKASGMRLSQVTQQNGWAILPLEEFAAELNHLNPDDPNSEANYGLLLSKLSQQGRASMEAGFHALLPGRLVAHFHSAAAILMSHERSLDKLRFDEFMKGTTPLSFHIYEPVLPGLRLSQLVGNNPQFQVHLLQNHGVILQLSSSQELEEWIQFENKFCQEFNYPLLAKLAAHQSPTAMIKDCEQHIYPLSDVLPEYMPDTIVFKNRIQSLLDWKRKHHNKSIATEGWSIFRDECELLMAGQLMFRLCPNLKWFPDHLGQQLCDLPTEKYRLRAK